MAIFLFQLTGFGSPSEPAIENAVMAINKIFKEVSPDFSTLTTKDIKTLYGSYNAIKNFLAVAKASGDQSKIEKAEHWLKQLNLPRSDVASKLVFLEGRLNELGHAKTNDASNLFAAMIQAGVNKLSNDVQKAKATL